MNTSLTLSKWVIFVLTFLAYTITFINGHPNAFSYSEPWTPTNSEDDVGSRSISYDDVQPSDEFEELDDEYDFNDLSDDVADDNFEYNSWTNNKRNPNSIVDKSYKNGAGYYLIEGPNHTVIGTTNLSKCYKTGVFQTGRTNNGPFLKNKNSGWYLAIGTSGNVYMTPTKNKDTILHTVVDMLDRSVYLYRIVTVNGQKTRLYLDIAPQSSTVQSGNTSTTTKFKARIGTTC
ncbi:hypothetical protein OS493_027135 [Desmophyllum pertusum]|uniref:Uncharacterized protein n=1 Tax=Desmophyllum pertusum TaxID=174260 RepID=A0A9X0D923_9CNID|nr:hypothetical protein OS493_027135 [Desmophyllum pertusum]